FIIRSCLRHRAVSTILRQRLRQLAKLASLPKRQPRLLRRQRTSLVLRLTDPARVDHSLLLPREYPGPAPKSKRPRRMVQRRGLSMSTLDLPNGSGRGPARRSAIQMHYGCCSFLGPVVGPRAALLLRRCPLWGLGLE